MHNVITDRKGTASVEFALVVLLLFMLVFGIIDAARMMWHWNAAAKATHWGIRFAVVNDPVDTGLANFDCLIAAGGNGVPCPAATMPTPIVCTQASCSPYTTGGTFDSAAFAAIVNRMASIYDGITAANVSVTYRHVGLGFAGNPYGSDIVPLVSVSLVGMNFNFLTPGLSGLATLNMPAFRTSMPGEDLSTN
jgi:Flp pilus assembly protein TadG